MPVQAALSSGYPSRGQPQAPAELRAGHNPAGSPPSAPLVPPDVGTAREGKERKHDKAGFE